MYKEDAALHFSCFGDGWKEREREFTVDCGSLDARRCYEGEQQVPRHAGNDGVPILDSV